MRKFRVWCHNKNEWETDYCLIASNGELFTQRRNGTIMKISAKTHIIQFYTGLKDKNGVEIYEGDIILISELSDGEYNTIIDESYYIAVEYDIESVGFIGNIFREPDTIFLADLHNKGMLDGYIIGDIYQEEYKHLRDEE